MSAASRPLRLVVVNDFPVVTAGVAALLEPYAQRVEVEQVVGDPSSTRQVDVLLLDTFGHPEPASRLTEVMTRTEAAVLVYGWADSQEQVEAALRLGAAGFLSKRVDAAAIVEAVEAAASGRPVPVTSVPQAGGAMAAWPGQDVGLTPRESEVLSLIVSGMSNQDIADRIYLSINSVKTYIRSAYRKMGVTSRSRAVLWGIEHGFHVDHPAASGRQPS
ncbi:MAG: Two-component transcriptional response regulator, LuxR family [uncultured Nocardioides sp.]|uniref:Two-component transcriptional response regulator, LuxR family n=1 Tax=uncultured Nocardioides sp. TaxID=198441 RepID=A0A6J4MXE0_9ACTN|nr:MAG: Two-component transcriptional response regulator, LuxR family [uncultured Nocardioides sp.]